MRLRSRNGKRLGAGIPRQQLNSRVMAIRDRRRPCSHYARATRKCRPSGSFLYMREDGCWFLYRAAARWRSSPDLDGVEVSYVKARHGEQVLLTQTIEPLRELRVRPPGSALGEPKEGCRKRS